MQALVAWLFARQRFGIKPGLGRVHALLESVEHPDRSFETVLVGGTNGKGSTASTLASILSAAGRRAGLFTSPHLTYFGERFKVDGRWASEDEVADALRDVKPHAERLNATFFEIVVVAACLVFARAEVEVAVLEVGMGGRYDATNAIQPVLSLITNVSLDHTQVLGNTVAEIAGDKAGILRAGRTGVTTATGEGLATILAEAERIGAEVVRVGSSESEHVAEAHFSVAKADWQGLELTVKNNLSELTVHSPLLGRHQASNVALAVVAAQQLGVQASAIEAGVKKTVWAGRLERLSYKNRTVLLDGAHNPAAAQNVRDSLKDLGVERVTLVVGAGQDKDAAGVLASLSEIAENIILTKAQLSPRATEPADLQRLVRNALVVESPTEALEHAVGVTGAEDIILVAGSLYLVGEVRPYLLESKGRGLSAGNDLARQLEYPGLAQNGLNCSCGTALSRDRRYCYPPPRPTKW